MNEEFDPAKIEQPVDILAKINSALTGLGSTMQWLRAPDARSEYKPLEGRRIVMVDDVQMVLEGMLPELIVATSGNAEPIHFTGQQVEDLIAQILSANPEIVLVDYHLSEQLKGSEVTALLRRAGFTGTVIGFSSDPDTVRAMERAGGNGCVKKEAGFPEDTVIELAKFIESKNL
ncbi:MAG: hypothetical protein COU11_02660 [Candidatus Harrisonbacteria bacterium CG10_big_fil_rev_8_21_14_0_10_49_15]|uniref:Response regulatory domain-containing protein n=1 Tax=Candidatus Harrisonbacteria bacterium CG10_big_fil_rev_8_21_14_0_10_49_15 TaxID=1974587 RepID=A0A2H0UL14_9BACT|nr:MAG: hypothetical protein COU11_02660 [Candidatus Harrisonbacteria bacterium CG10_big_fil_rev_8_21_14_0_10_49_15]